MFFYGTVAVGTHEGHVYLLDLALDAFGDVEDDNDVSGYRGAAAENGDDQDAMVSTEARPASLHFLSVSDGAFENIAAVRQRLARRSAHLCLRLNDVSFASNRTFQHISSSSGDSVYFPVERVAVCALKFVPQLASLAVGLNFGAFQLWNLSRLCVEFSSTYAGTESLPLTGFTFQEPENDPRNFCYLWTMQSEDDFETHEEKMSVSSLGAVTLHALSYDHRDEADQYGVLYSGLASCQARFAHTMLADPLVERDVVGSIGLACSALAPPHARGALAAAGAQAALADVTDPDALAGNPGLAAFLWEAHYADEDQPDFYFGLFDLNAWYQAQMPQCVELEEDAAQQCPYFTFTSLEDVVQAAREGSFGGGGGGGGGRAASNVVGVGVDLSSLSRYQSLTNAEQHFYPSSLAFDMTCLLDGGIVCCANLGFQRKVLLELLSQGRSGLVEPQHLHQLCLAAGLIVREDGPHGGGGGGGSVLSAFSDVREQRAQLLTVALENHLVNLLTGCIAHWRDGKYAQADCTLKFILDWAWERLTHTKQMIDRVTLGLFDLSTVELNEVTRRSLVQSSQHLRHLCSVLEQLAATAHSAEDGLLVASEEGVVELGTKCEAAALVNQYLKVLMWFFDAGLLPEVPEDPACVDPQFSNSPYPYSLLLPLYKNKRAKMKQLLARFADVEAPCLIVDGLCRQLGDVLEANFERDGGDGLFPPPSLHALLSLYLISSEQQHSSQGGYSTLEWPQ